MFASDEIQDKCYILVSLSCKRKDRDEIEGQAKTSHEFGNSFCSLKKKNHRKLASFAIKWPM